MEKLGSEEPLRAFRLYFSEHRAGRRRPALITSTLPLLSLRVHKLHPLRLLPRAVVPEPSRPTTLTNGTATLSKKSIWSLRSITRILLIPQLDYQMWELPKEECKLLQPKNLEIIARNIATMFLLVCSHLGCFCCYSYYELPLHELACPHGACSCTELGYNYTSPPVELVVHLAEEHLIEVIRISYGHAQLLQEQVSFPNSARCWLIFQGEDDSVFVLSITAGVPGTRAGPTFVCAVCVRSVSSAWPLYMVRMWANAQPPSSDSMLVLAEAPRCLTPWEVEYADLRSILCVPS